MFNGQNVADQTMLEACVDVKMTEGSLLLLFYIGFTKKKNVTTRYAKMFCVQHQQAPQIWKKRIEMLEKPKFKLRKLMELCGEGGSSEKTPHEETSVNELMDMNQETVENPDTQ
ncbi:hypothetical protein STEG23_030326 [Scotinomys teguina]